MSKRGNRYVEKSSSAASTNRLSWLNSAWWPLPSGGFQPRPVRGSLTSGSSSSNAESPMITGLAGSSTFTLT
jgi:hypothetical protein